MRLTHITDPHLNMNNVHVEKQYFTIQELSEKIFDSILHFLNARSLNGLYETKNNLIQNAMVNHLQPFYDDSSSTIVWDEFEDSNAFGNLLFKARSKSNPESVTHIIIKGFCVTDDVEMGRTSNLVRYAKRFTKLKTIEFTEILIFLSEPFIRRIVEDVSEECPELEEIVCQTFLKNENRYWLNQFQYLLESSSTINRVRVKDELDVILGSLEDVGTLGTLKGILEHKRNIFSRLLHYMIRQLKDDLGVTFWTLENGGPLKNLKEIWEHERNILYRVTNYMFRKFKDLI